MAMRSISSFWASRRPWMVCSTAAGFFGVPLELGHMPLGDVVDVEEFFLLVLLVPDLATRVARVEEDHAEWRTWTRRSPNGAGCEPCRKRRGM
jgi:hypothetical protein